jgi:hypothetical protein
MVGALKRGVWYFGIVVGFSGAATDGAASSVRKISNDAETDTANFKERFLSPTVALLSITPEFGYASAAQPERESLISRTTRAGTLSPVPARVAGQVDRVDAERIKAQPAEAE